MKTIRRCAILASVAFAAAPQPLWACAACFGKSDSGLAKGMNWGILSLLAVVVFVLSGFAAFFIYLARRAAHMSRAAGAASGALPEPSKQV